MMAIPSTCWGNRWIIRSWCTRSLSRSLARSLTSARALSNNKILLYQCGDRFKLNKKKHFVGHTIAGYACQIGGIAPSLPSSVPSSRPPSLPPCDPPPLPFSLLPTLRPTVFLSVHPCSVSNGCVPVLRDLRNEVSERRCLMLTHVVCFAQECHRTIST